jgi:hypothetical protein
MFFWGNSWVWVFENKNSKNHLGWVQVLETQGSWKNLQIEFNIQMI